MEFEVSEYSLARWVSSDDRKKLEAFISANGSGIADDVDGDPVFMAKNEFYLGYTKERAEGIEFSAVKDVKKTGQVKIVAFDEADETLAGIKAGAIYATVVQQPFEFGYQAIKLMRQALKGDKTFIPANKQIAIPTMVVNKSNVEDFSKRIDELRGRK